MSRRNLLCCLWISALSVSACLSIPVPEEARTLTAAETWQIYGGGTIQNYCCKDIADCAGVAISCTAFQEKNCATSKATNIYSVGVKDCQSGMAGTSCTQANTAHVCRSMDYCTWDPDLSACAPAGQSNSTSAPDSCSDSCPI